MRKINASRSRALSILLLVIMGIFSSGVYGQKLVSGRVTDASDQSPMPGVTVLVKGSTLGTTTDFEGNFQLNVPDEGSMIVFPLLAIKPSNCRLPAKRSFK